MDHAEDGPGELLLQLRAAAAHERGSLNQEALVLIAGGLAARETAEERAQRHARAWRALDSDTCFGILRGRSEVLERRALEVDEVVTMWVTASALFYVVSKSAKPESNTAVVIRFLTALPALAPDLASARLLGEVKA